MHSSDERRLLEEKYGHTESPEFFADCGRLKRGEPLAYVIGWQPFLGLNIYLDSHPLIPRPETEWWTEQLLRTLEPAKEMRGVKLVRQLAKAPSAPKIRNPLNFLDLCAGSGAIGCAALKSLPNANVYFGEIDPVHDATIRKNILENRLDASRADIRIGDVFAPFAGMKFDIIAANPPYIPEGRSLEASVQDHEPHLALFSGADGLSIIRSIARALPRYLKKTGIAWIECDNSNIEAACRLFETEGLITNIQTDQYGVPRVLVVQPVG